MIEGDKLVWIDPDNQTSSLITIFEIRRESKTVLGKTEDGLSEVECFIHELKKPVDVYCCKKCGNIDIQERAWVYSNTFTYADVTDDDSLAWCDECNNTTTIINLEEFLNNKNNDNSN